MRLVVTGTSEALKDIEKAHELLRQLEDIIRRINKLGWVDVKGEITIEGESGSEKE